MAKKGASFDKLLTEAVDGALLCLGGSAKEAIYFHLEDKFGITKSEIHNQLEGFENGLEKIFGGSGATYLEILIMKRLYEKIGEPLEWDEGKNLTFAEYAAAAKKSYLKTKK